MNFLKKLMSVRSVLAYANYFFLTSLLNIVYLLSDYKILPVAVGLLVGMAASLVLCIVAATRIFSGYSLLCHKCHSKITFNSFGKSVTWHCPYCGGFRATKFPPFYIKDNLIL